MFGDEPMFGQTELEIDNSNNDGRIIIPEDTKREPGEILSLIFNKYSKHYEIYNINGLKDKFFEINERLKNAKTKKERRFYEEMLFELSRSVLLTSKVDLAGGFSTGIIFDGYDRLLSTGAVDHLIIDPIKKK